MSRIASRLNELDLTLPAVAAPVAAYIPALAWNGVAQTSGQLPFVDGQLAAMGKVGAAVSAEDAQRCARIATLNALAALEQQLGDLDRVTRVVKVTVFVASDVSFTGQPQVANGASELLGDVFGDAGAHVRSAVGVAVLPLDAPVEVEVVVAYE